MASTYQSQDRGSQNDYTNYLSAMDAVSVEKVASSSVFYDPTPGNIIVDVGMASGTSSSILAHLFPNLKIIGVDINPKMVEIASQTYQLPNLEFRMDDGEKLTTFESNTISGFFNCSAIHHITSFNGYEPYRAFSTIKRQAELLKTGGIIVVRDFVKPPEMEVILELSEIAEKDTPSDAELLISFSQTARSLANQNEKGFPLKEIKRAHKNTKRFQLYFADAVEFIRRKDYYHNWEVELQEEYGYFTQNEFENIFANLGLRVVVSYPIYNPWIVRNRYKAKFTLYDKNLNDIGFPPTNYLIAGEKITNRGSNIKIVRHLPETEKPFIQYNSYKDIQTQKIIDVALRPNSVVDIIPFFNNGENIEIIAKHGYPRPIVNIETDCTIIDQKHYSGYITEGITASSNQPVELILTERTNLQALDFSKIEKSLEYYTSPGGINEKVDSIFVELKKSPVEEFTTNSYSGFADSGSIRKYDAIQLLKTAQTGALVEARLELNIYNLLRKFKIDFPPWLGEKIEIETLPINRITPLSNILDWKEKRFAPTKESAGYLQKHRAKFAESGVKDSANILEFITPQNLSTNTLLTLPVTEYNNEIYVGLEIRNLPVPQLHSGNSCIPVAPACRLPKEIKTYKDLENFMHELNIYGSGINHFAKLGEKFFPSVGITPEQVYPYVVLLTEATEGLEWVSLNELYGNLESLKDGHLLISIVRLFHAIQN
jgi:ubiquinone/menaquinone biosynthesis C-methylase UbiE